MSMEPISFELIRKIEREELQSAKLTKLPEGFYEKVKEYLELKKSLEKEGRKIATEVRNVEKLIKTIFSKREKKIVDAALKFFDSNVIPENMTEEEREFFDKIVRLVEERRNKTLSKILLGERKVKKLIVFEEDVPQFVGVDEKIYGPFKKGDIASLPEENMKLLIEQGLARELEVKE